MGAQEERGGVDQARGGEAEGVGDEGVKGEGNVSDGPTDWIEAGAAGEGGVVGGGEGGEQAGLSVVEG